MIKEKIYNANNSIDEWVSIIEGKFNDIDFLKRDSIINNILGVNNEIEYQKIKKASLIAYGKKISILSYEDACNKLNKDISFIELKGLLPYEIANRKLTIIVEAINNGWTPNWNDHNQPKWCPRFNLNRFSFGDTTFYSWYNSSSVVGSRLCLKSQEDAYYIGNMFIELYKDYIL